MFLVFLYPETIKQGRREKIKKKGRGKAPARSRPAARSSKRRRGGGDRKGRGGKGNSRGNLPSSATTRKRIRKKSKGGESIDRKSPSKYHPSSLPDRRNGYGGGKRGKKRKEGKK